MKVAGIDIGSLSTKAVIMDESRTINGSAITPTRASSRLAAEEAFNQALRKANLTPDGIGEIVVTGYGRISFPHHARKVTEIACHAAGAHYLFPGTRTVIDIGGQDCKVIALSKRGQVIDFVMNDKCAAGTGRFLEVMSQALGVPLESMGPLSFSSRNRLSITNMCTVFAESEVVSLVAEGHPTEDIIRGLHDAVARRIAAMVQRIGLEREVTMTGGVALNSGVVKAIEEAIGVKLNVPPEPQMAGALGAALIALSPWSTPGPDLARTDSGRGIS